MLLPTMQRNRSRSSSGTAGSAASASTRRLNAISDSSRLIGEGSSAGSRAATAGAADGVDSVDTGATVGGVDDSSVTGASPRN